MSKTNVKVFKQTLNAFKWSCIGHGFVEIVYMGHIGFLMGECVLVGVFLYILDECLDGRMRPRTK